MSTISKLMNKILKSKGLNDEHITALEEAGISEKTDFEMVGDAQTLVDITGLDEQTSLNVMEWALGTQKASQNDTKSEASSIQQGSIVIEGADIIKCVHCGARQPKDYKSGDLCLSCGNQAEPVLSCYWCLNSGPGKFCRACGAEFVPSADFELALYLKREGESKSAIGNLVRNMSLSEKEKLWAKIRR